MYYALIQMIYLSIQYYMDSLFGAYTCLKGKTFVLLILVRITWRLQERSSVLTISFPSFLVLYDCWLTTWLTWALYQCKTLKKLASTSCIIPKGVYMYRLFGWPNLEIMTFTIEICVNKIYFMPFNSFVLFGYRRFHKCLPDI